jgi:hypothetical protein
MTASIPIFFPGMLKNNPVRLHLSFVLPTTINAEVVNTFKSISVIMSPRMTIFAFIGRLSGRLEKGSVVKNAGA